MGGYFTFGLGLLYPSVDVGTVYIGIVTAIHIEVMAVFHELGTQGGKELGIKGYSLYILTAL